MESYSLFSFCTKLLSLEVEILWTCLVSLVSPLFWVMGLMFRGGGGRVLLGRIAVGIVGAAYVGMVLVILMSLAGVLGVGLVRAWMEEPVSVRESLQFDYTDAHPTALFSFGPPAGHTLYVSLLLLMPDSDYNRDVGIFQLSAEAISFQGNIITKSIHPSMLVFRSWPIRYTRTFLMGLPLLLGITTETQTITFPILKHKEAPHPRTHHLRITLFPRAGTSALPQFYDAQILLNSRPPWTKEVVYHWKLTFCVWATMCIFLMLVLVFMKPLIFPAMTRPHSSWQRSASKRKAPSFLLHGDGEAEESSVYSSASSMTDSHGNFCCGDSESVCS